MQKLLTLKQASEKIQIDENTLRLWARARKLPALKCGRQWRFSEKILDRWIERGSKKGGYTYTHKPRKVKK